MRIQYMYTYLSIYVLTYLPACLPACLPPSLPNYIHHWRILWSSNRKLVWVEFEPTKSEFCWNALTDWAIRPWVQLPLILYIYIINIKTLELTLGQNWKGILSKYAGRLILPGSCIYAMHFETGKINKFSPEN